MKDQFRPPWLRRENTSGRAFWIIWCLLWAAFWFVTTGMAKTTYAFGYTVQHYSPVWPEIMFVLSLAALLLPVGKK
jgi:hypothetical protein